MNITNLTKTRRVKTSIVWSANIVDDNENIVANVRGKFDPSKPNGQFYLEIMPGFTEEDTETEFEQFKKEFLNTMADVEAETTYEEE